LENLSLVIPGIVFTVGLGYMVGIWLNLFLYDKGLKEAETFLDIVEKYSLERCKGFTKSSYWL
jgi:hypothetical protein